MEQKTIIRSYTIGAAIALISLTAISQSSKRESMPTATPPKATAVSSTQNTTINPHLAIASADLKFQR